MKNLVPILLLSIALIMVIFILVQPKINSSGKTASIIFFRPSWQNPQAYSPTRNSQSLDQLIKQDTNDIEANFGIYIKNLKTKQQAILNPDLQFNTASLYKLFVMYTIYEKGTKVQLDLNNPGIQQDLDQMITESSNEAALSLVDTYTSWEEITSQMHELGLTQTDLNQDPPLTTPADVGKLLELISNGKAVDFNSSFKMLDLMAKQTRRDRIPADLPKGAVIANKTGEMDDVLHDVAVVGTDKSDYIIILMTKDSADLDKTRGAMQKISVDVYNYFNNQWGNFPKIL